MADADPMRRQYRPLREDEQQVLDAFKARVEDLWRMVNSWGSSREISLAKTKLEEAVMWATKELTR